MAMKILVAALFTITLTTHGNSAPVPLFNGASLDGWEGDAKLWRVEDGMITGGSLTENVPRNEFLATKKRYHNFDLRLKLKLTGAGGFVNSGVQVRSIHVPGSSEMSGYQVDAGEGWWGKLYDESRRNKVIAEPLDAVAANNAVRRNDWNEYRVRCDGARVQAWINGVATIDYTEADPKIAQDGLIGIQLHGGGKTVVQVKEVTLEELPPTPNAPRWPDNAANGSSPKSSGEERAAFTLPAGFTAELVADEAVMKKAVAFNFDNAGRMWVTTASEYPLDANEQPEKAALLYKEGGGDNVLIFDTPWADGIQTPRVWAGMDGKLGVEDRRPEGQKLPPSTRDPRSSTFHLAMPMGVLPYKDGAIVQHGADLLFLRDTDGDGRADRKELLLTGFGIQDSHLMPHGFTRGPGDWIYFAQGAFNTSPVRTREGPIVEVKFCKMMRMKPDGSRFEICSWGPNNIWGFVIDPRGEMWLQEANDLGYPLAAFQPGMTYPGIGDDKPKPYAPVTPPPVKLNDCTMGGTGLSGLALNEDFESWPAPWTGAFMIANPITNKIQAIRVHREGDGSGGAKLEKLPDFLVSADTHFRPVAIQFGPDGSLYVIDWYNKIISHNEVPRAHPERDKVRTRIWRIRAMAAPRRKVPDLTKLADDQLVAHLDASNQWEANASRFELIDRPAKMPLLRTLAGAVVSDANGRGAATLHQRLQRYWALEAVGALEDETIRGSLLQRDFSREPPAMRREFARSGLLGPHAVAEHDSRVLAELARSSHATVLSLLRMVPAPGLADGAPEKAMAAPDADFLRYLIRSRIEKESAQIKKSLMALDANSPEGRQLEGEPALLAALSLPPEEGARFLIRWLPAIRRPLIPEEIYLLARRSSEPAVYKAFEALLRDPKRQAATLAALASFDPKMLATARGLPALPELIAGAARALVTQEPTRSNRDLLVRLARNFRLSDLERDVTEDISQSGEGSAEQISGLKALRELGSGNVGLFRKLAETRHEELRREAITTLAGAPGSAVVPALTELWPQLSPPLRKIALDRIASSRAQAEALVGAVNGGAIPAADLDGTTLDKLASVLGNDHPELSALLKETRTAMRPVLRLNGKPGDIAETRLDLTGPFTVESWVCLDPGIDNNDNLLGRKGGADVNFYGGRLRVFANAAVHDVVVARSPIKPNTWTHVAVTRDSEGRLRIYLNGELDAESVITFNETLAGLNIGETNPGKGCGSRYTEFRVWDIARTADELRDNYLLSFAEGADLAAVPRTHHAPSTDQPQNPSALFPVHLVRYMNGAKGWGPLKGTARIEQTRDFPELLNLANARALAEKFTTFRQLAASEGNAQNGRNLFNGICLVCHVVNGQGGNIGPNLSGAGAIGTEALLRNILTPNAQLESGYYRHDAELKNGDMLSGFLVSQNEQEIVMRPIGGDDRTVERSAIKKLTIARKSLMPEGLLDGMQPEQVSDLFAYLRTLK